MQLREEGHELEDGSLRKYVDMPKLYRYDKSKKKRIRRQARSEDVVIGKVHSINPLAGEADQECWQRHKVRGYVPNSASCM